MTAPLVRFNAGRSGPDLPFPGEISEWLEAWLGKLAAEDAPTDPFKRAQAAADRIREIQKRSMPDPEGWTVHDYIDHGRP